MLDEHCTDEALIAYTRALLAEYPWPPAGESSRTAAALLDRLRARRQFALLAELADRVAILNRGLIEQLGSPAETYDQPASPFVYSFVGAVNRLAGEWREGRLHVAGLDLANEGPAGDGPIELFVRPEHLQMGTGGQGWAATILSSQRSGARQRVLARLQATDMEVEIELPAGSDKSAHVPGAEIGVHPTHFGVFPR